MKWPITTNILIVVVNKLNERIDQITNPHIFYPYFFKFSKLAF